MVEDNLDHAELIRRTLGSGELSCEIIHVGDGDAAMEYLQSHTGEAGSVNAPPDLILLDIRLPKRSGMEVLRAVREHQSFAPIPVVILTTSANVDDVREAYSLHANSYLVKPFDFREFRALLEDMGLYWLFWNQPGSRSADGTDP